MRIFSRRDNTPEPMRGALGSDTLWVPWSAYDPDAPRSWCVDIYPVENCKSVTMHAVSRATGAVERISYEMRMERAHVGALRERR